MQVQIRRFAQSISEVQSHFVAFAHPQDRAGKNRVVSHQTRLSLAESNWFFAGLELHLDHVGTAAFECSSLMFERSLSGYCQV